MAMNELRIKKLSPADRCDICHQSDQFNAESGICVRCQAIAKPYQDDKLPDTTDNIIYFLEAKILLLIIFMISLLLIGHLVFGLESLKSIFLLLMGGYFIAAMIGGTLNPNKAVFKDKMQRTIRFDPIDEKKLSQIDITELNSRTDQLLKLGFICGQDYQVKNGGAIVFHRLFYHPSWHCFADLYFLSGEEKIRINFTSYDEQHWSINTSMTKWSSLFYILRVPKRITYFYDNLATEELLQEHLQMRDEVIKELNSNLLTGLAIEHYISRAETFYHQEISIFENKIYLIYLFQQFWYELFPKDRILGDYRPLIK